MTDVILNQIQLQEKSAPATPPSGKVALYAKTDGKAYIKDDTGAETDLTATSASGDPFPVGSIFISVVSTNPSTLLGYGTWSAFAAGRVLVGIDAGQTEFDTVKETGGAKTVVLGANDIPAHTHPVVDPGHVHGISTGTTDGAVGRVDSASSAQAATFNTNSATTGITVGNNVTTGSGHNNLQPYIVVYMWERTA